MPELNWTEGERKAFWRMARSSVWTFLVVLAILLVLGVVKLPSGWGLLVLLIYVAALWVPIYKFVRMRWPG